MKRLIQALLWRLVFGPSVRTVSAVNREPEDLLEASLEVVQTQILAQLTEETSIDGQTMGWLAFLGALLAVDIAAKGFLSEWWWTPLVGVGAATVPCLWSLFSGAPQLGPRIVLFYERYGGHDAKAARTQLLADMYASFRRNGARVKWKRRRLRIAVLITIVGLSGAALMITLDTPTKLPGHGTQNKSHGHAKSASARTRTGAGAISGADGHHERLVAL